MDMVRHHNELVDLDSWNPSIELDYLTLRDSTFGAHQDDVIGDLTERA